MTARLVRADDGRQLWYGQYDDEQTTNIFDIQDAISEQVTRELALRLTASEEQRLTRRDTGNLAAYEASVRGRLFLSLAQPRQAIEMFERAVRLDPDFARAHAGLADTLSRLPIATDGPSEEAMERARALALTALGIDPDRCCSAECTSATFDTRMRLPRSPQPPPPAAVHGRRERLPRTRTACPGVCRTRDRSCESWLDLRSPPRPPISSPSQNVGLGDPSAALTWLERAYEEQDVRMVFLGVDPVWEPLRDDARFAALLKRMHLGQTPRL